MNDKNRLFQKLEKIISDKDIKITALEDGYFYYKIPYCNDEFGTEFMSTTVEGKVQEFCDEVNSNLNEVINCLQNSFIHAP
jgi:hypothetical protein